MNDKPNPEEVQHIRITDGYIRRIVAEEQARRGDKTATKTAAQMILERYTQLQERRTTPQPAALAS
jgi:hypothetical protein